MFYGEACRLVRKEEFQFFDFSRNRRKRKAGCFLSELIFCNLFLHPFVLNTKNQEEAPLGTEIKRVHRGRQPVKFDVVASVFEVFGDTDRCLRWLESPCLALRGASPLSLLETSSGVEMILNELERIEHEAFIAGMVF